MTGTSSKNGIIARAERYEDQGRLHDAFTHWRKAIDLEADPVSLCRFGRVATKIGEWAEAENAFKQAIDIDPGFPNAYECLGILYLKRNRLEEASDALTKSVELEETVHALTLLGVTQFRLHRLAAARRTLKRALTYDPNQQDALFNLGLTWRYRKPSEALKLYRRVLELDPEFDAAHREIGLELTKSNEYEEAKYHLKRAITLNDSDGWAHIYFGHLMWSTGDFAQAEKAFKRAVRIWPDYEFTYLSLAYFYQHQGRGEKAERLYRKALQLEPDDPETLLRFGLHLKDIGEITEATHYLKRASIMNPGDKRLRAALRALRRGEAKHSEVG